MYYNFTRILSTSSLNMTATLWIWFLLTAALDVSEASNKNTPKLPERPQLVLEALAKNKPLYYFGLGSNMSRKKLENRGADGTKISIKYMEAAVVKKYRLAFNLKGFPPIEPGMGSLEPIEEKSKALLTYEHGECHGALVKLTPENYEKVMRSEGITGRADQGYDEIVVDAYAYSRPGKPVKAVALRARDHVRLKFDPCPSLRYMKILREGAKELGLKPCYQEFLAKHPVQAIPNWQKRVALYNLALTASISFKLKWRGFSRFQSWWLFKFYLPSTAPALPKFFSDLATTLVLLPGAIFGFAWFQITEATGTTPPFLKRIMSIFDESTVTSDARV
jgi:hypothetical protein